MIMKESRYSGTTKKIIVTVCEVSERVDRIRPPAQIIDTFSVNMYAKSFSVGNCDHTFCGKICLKR